MDWAVLGVLLFAFAALAAGSSGTHAGANTVEASVERSAAPHVLSRAEAGTTASAPAVLRDPFRAKASPCPEPDLAAPQQAPRFAPRQSSKLTSLDGTAGTPLLPSAPTARGPPHSCA